MRKAAVAVWLRGLIGAVVVASLLGACAASACASIEVTTVNSPQDRTASEATAQAGGAEACNEEDPGEICTVRAALELARSVSSTAIGVDGFEVFLPDGRYAVNRVKGPLPLGDQTTACDGGSAECSMSIVGESTVATVIEGKGETALVAGAPTKARIAIEDLTMANGGGVERGGAFRGSSESVLSVQSVAFVGNAASKAGGAIYMPGGETRISESSFSHNAAADEGGALFSGAGEMVLERSSLVANETEGAGGALFTEGPTTLRNDTLAANTASEGAAVQTTDAASVYYSTIAQNTASAAGAGALQGGSRFALEGAIVSGNTPNQCAETEAPEASGANIVFGASACAFPAPAPLAADPRLAPLTTMGSGEGFPLLAGSPAVNAGGASCASAGGVDTRGEPRPQGPGCDLGSFEAASDAAVTLTASPQAIVGELLELTATATDRGSEPLTATTVTIAVPADTSFMAAPGCTLASPAGGGYVTCPLGTIEAGRSAWATLTVRATTPGAALAHATVAHAEADYEPGQDSANVPIAVLAASGPGGPGTGAKGGPTATAAKATLVGSTLTVDRHGDLLAKVRCAGSSSGGCNTMLDLYAAGGTLPAVASSRKAVLLARAHVTIAAGRTGLVRLRLSASARRKLTAAHPRLLARVLLSAHGTTATVSSMHYAVVLKRERARR